MMKSVEYFRSGELEVYPQRGHIVARGGEIRLGPVNMRVLVLLLQQPGQVVERADFFNSVWKNQSVSDDALTRCISDLRTQLEVISGFEKIIETVPKRGYRWLPAVENITVQSPAPTAEQGRQISSKLVSWLGPTALVLTMMVVFAMSGLWVLSYIKTQNVVTIALLPLVASQPEQERLAADMDELLRSYMLKQADVRLLSAGAVATGLASPYPYFARSFGARWVVEGSVRRLGHQFRVSLNVVEASTAIVLVSRVATIDSKPNSLKLLGESFVDDMILLHD